MLSNRGSTASIRSPEILWDVLSNPYNPDIKPTGFVNLGIAENSLMQPELLSYIRDNFCPPSTALSYGEGPHGSERLRSTLASFINKFFSPFIPIENRHISISSGVTGSIERCAFELGDPGDAFLLGRPYYGAFSSEVGDRAQIQIIPVSFGESDPMGLDAVTVYEKALTEANARSQRVRAILLCNPHNPLGRCYTEEFLVALMRLCQDYGLHLLVDEIYAFSVFQNPENPRAVGFTSALAIDTTTIIDPALVHVLWGVSKDFGCNGLRIGCVISPGNPALIAALDGHAPYRFPAAFLEYVVCLILEDDEFVTEYVSENRRRIAESYAVVTWWLQRHKIPYHRGTNAGLFVWANLGAAWERRQRKRYNCQRNGRTDGASWTGDQVTVGAEKEQGHTINEEINHALIAAKVYLTDGDECGSEIPGYFRIVFTQPRHILEVGLAKIAGILEL